jgi:hypothetical protein
VQINLTLLFVAYVALASIVAWIARQKNRSPLYWFLGGMTPVLNVIFFIAVLVVPPLDDDEPAHG